MAKRMQGRENHYDPVSQKFLAELAGPSSTRSQAVPVSQPPVSPLKLRSREKRVLLDAEEDVLCEAQVQRLAAELGTPLKMSHVLRAFLALFRRSEPYLLARARQAGPLARPSNGDLEALGRFEDKVAEVLAAALRDLPPRP